MKAEEKIREILESKTRCTITEEAEDVNENYYFKWGDVVEAIKEFAESQSKEIGALRKQVHDYDGKLQDQKDLIEKQSKEIDELKKFKEMYWDFLGWPCESKEKRKHPTKGKDKTV
jgi:hypothetical protein